MGKNRAKRSLLFILVVVGIAAQVEGSEKLPVEVTTRVDREIIGIGDKVRYSIEVSTGKGIEVEFPVFEGEIGGLPIRDFDFQEKRFFGKRRLLQWYTISTYEPGAYTIPKAVVKYRKDPGEDWQEVEIDEIKVEVKSILKGEKGVLDIRDIKGPIDIRNILFFIIIGIIIVVIIVGLTWAFFSTRHKGEAAVPPPKPAHIVAYEALDELKRKDYIRQGMIKEYYIGLSDIIRHYLENRFNMRAPEMTTEEFLLQAKDTKELSREDKRLLRDFMSHCDLVKFAKYGPTDAEINSSSESAKRLVDKTKIEDREEAAVK